MQTRSQCFASNLQHHSWLGKTTVGSTVHPESLHFQNPTENTGLFHTVPKWITLLSLNAAHRWTVPLLPLGLLSIFHPISAPGKVEGGDGFCIESPKFSLT